MRIALTICLLSGATVLAQSVARSPRELIDFLNYEEFARPDFLAAQMGLFGCGRANADRRAAIELVGLGAHALPEIEKELRLIKEPNGHLRIGANLVQTAYAQLRGTGAYAELFAIAYNSRKDKRPASNDTAIALALGITSFVTSPLPTGRNFSCFRSDDPRDALNRFLAGWLQSDRDAVASALAPATKIAFERVAPAADWKSYAPVWSAVGFQFNGGGPWSEPAGRLSETNEIDIRFNASVVEMGGQIMSFNGQPCDDFQIRFVRRRPADDGRYLGYAVDIDDLPAFLQSVAACANRFR